MPNGPIFPIQSSSVDLTQRHEERINQKDTLQKPFSLSLTDIDNILLYYFDDVIKPIIPNQGKLVKVPIKFANPERWKSIRKERKYKDEDGKIQTPIIVLRRSNIVIDKELGGKMDANNPQKFKSFIIKYNRFKKYNRFDIVNNIRPSYEVQNVIIPDYLDLSYDCIIWTEYYEQMNTILESVIYSQNSYWGNNQFKFRARIDSFSDATQVGVEDERNIMSNFTLQLKGYIVPNTLNQYLTHTPVDYTKSLLQVTFTEKSSFELPNPTNPIDLVSNNIEIDNSKNRNNRPNNNGGVAQAPEGREA